MSELDKSAAALASMVEQLGRQVQHLGFTKELAPVQWSALRYFAKAGPSARTVSGLAAYTGVNQSSASRTIQLLLNKELVEAIPDPRDNRSKTVSLTARGRDLLGHDPLHKLATAVGTLDAVERAALAALVEKLMFRLCPRPFDVSAESIATEQ